MRCLALLTVLSATCFAADQAELASPSVSTSTTAAAIVSAAPSSAEVELAALKAKLAAIEAEKAAAAAAAEVKARTPVYRPGVRVRIYTPKEGAIWPPHTWEPDQFGLVETLTLPAIPAVESALVDGVPNKLVLSKTGSIDSALIYAVRFEGYLYAPESGEYSYAVKSDDPTILEVNGRVIASSQFAVQNPISYNVNGGLELGDLRKATDTVGGSIELIQGRYYTITLTAFQHWAPGAATDKGGSETIHESLKAAYDRLSPLVCGATLSATMSTPSGDSKPLKTYLLAKPEEKKP